jgi:hypothetical protein
MQKQADSQRLRKGELHTVEDDEDMGDMENLSNHIYMELQSTVAFKEIDIDQMLQHTTMDDFLRGLYVRAVDTPGASTGKPMNQHDRLLSQLMNTRDESLDSSRKGGSQGGPTLDFSDGTTSSKLAAEDSSSVDKYRGENLRQLAIQNLKERRQRQKQSEIFNQQEAARKKESEEEQQTGEGTESVSGLQRIDLTKTQLASTEGEGDSANQVDDFDLLDAKIDPKDLRTLQKVQRLQDEIEYEKTKIKMKFIFKYSFQTTDPLRISE